MGHLLNVNVRWKNLYQYREVDNMDSSVISAICYIFFNTCQNNKNYFVPKLNCWESHLLTVAPPASWNNSSCYHCKVKVEYRSHARRYARLHTMCNDMVNVIGQLDTVWVFPKFKLSWQFRQTWLICQILSKLKIS